MPKQTISPPSGSVQSTSGFGWQLMQASTRSYQGFLVFHVSLEGHCKTLLPKPEPQGYLRPSCFYLLVTHLKSEGIKEVTSIFLIYQSFWCCTILLGDVMLFQHCSFHFIDPALQAPNCPYSTDSLQDLQEVLLQNIKKNPPTGKVLLKLLLCNFNQPS